MRSAQSKATTRSLVVATSSVLALTWATAGLAQTAPSRTLPETIAPAVHSADGSVILPPTRLTAAPAGADNLSVRIDRVTVQDAAPQYADAIAALVRSVEGRTVTVAALYEVAARIEALYARDGHILTRATVPPQSLQDGAVLRIVVVEGFIESIDDSQTPQAVRAPVRQRLAGLVNVRGLTLSQIERRVLLATRVPGVNLRTTLVPGEQVGGARLVLQVEHQPISASIGADNGLSDAYDNWSYEVRLAANSVFGTGEQIYALGTTAGDFRLWGGAPHRRIAGVGLIAPLGADGLTAQVEYLRADTNPVAATGALPINGQFDRVLMRLSYPLILTRRETLSVSGGFEWAEESQTARGFGVQLSHDRLRSLTLGLNGAKAISGMTTLSANIDFAQGLSGMGARTPTEAFATGTPLSRQGSKPDFSRLVATASLDQRLNSLLSARIVVRGQTGFGGVMPSAMQFSLDGGDAISGFDAGAINVDNGVTGRLELSAFAPIGGQLLVRPYLFASAGKGWLEQPTALEKRAPDGWSAGGGVRTTLTERVYLNTELAYAESNMFAKNQTRLSASVNVAF